MGSGNYQVLGYFGGATASAYAAETPGGGVPWYVWLAVALVLVAFAAFVYYWWLRGNEQEEHGAVAHGASAVAPPRQPMPDPAGVEPLIGAEDPVEAVEPALPHAPAEPATWDERPAETDAPVLHPAPAAELAAQPEPDDLKLIEGIGPKIAGVLNAAGIWTFRQLADLAPARITEILGQADTRLLRLADPTTWPEQARLAAAGETEELLRLQDSLKGGRRT